MTQIRRPLAAIALLLAAVSCGCKEGGGTSENQGSDAKSRSEHVHDGGEHSHDGGEHEREGRSEHDRDADDHRGEEGEEAGTEFALDESYDETRNGARLILVYDAQSNSFQGTVENTTDETLKRVRVEVHLSNGKELGPTTPADLEPGQKTEVTLTATSKDFDGWSAHPEVGSGEHGHGEVGEHDRDEHDREGQSE